MRFGGLNISRLREERSGQHIRTPAHPDLLEATEPMEESTLLAAIKIVHPRLDDLVYEVPSVFVLDPPTAGGDTMRSSISF